MRSEYLRCPRSEDPRSEYLRFEDPRSEDPRSEEPRSEDVGECVEVGWIDVRIDVGCGHVCCA